jgi:serine protease Do
MTRCAGKLRKSRLLKERERLIQAAGGRCERDGHCPMTKICRASLRPSPGTCADDLVRCRSWIGKLSAWIILPLLLLSCSYPNHAQLRQTTLAPTPAAEPATAGLSDFTMLVTKEGATVVNISTKQNVRAPSDYSPFRGLPEDDPFKEFFRRFIPRHGPREFQTQSLESGFVISDDGFILTNAHVVRNADEVTVKLTDRREFRAKVIGSDRRTDLALLKIDVQGLQKVPIGDPSKLKVGEWVAAIGSPFGFENTVTKGIVSAQGRALPDENYVPFIQTDVPINPGNSGGPLFNLQGQVVGINSQIYSRNGGYMGLSFAIPIDIAMNVADQLRIHGKVTRGRLGVLVQELTPALASSFGRADTNGALIAKVDKGSPASQAGLTSGDVILEYDGKKLKDFRDLGAMVSATKPGSRIGLEIWRNGSPKTLTATVAELPAEQAATHGGERPASNPLGLTLNELSGEDRRHLGVDHGLVVEDAEGTAAKAGIREGDVILAINGNGISTISEFADQLAKAPSGHAVALLIQRHGHALYVAVPPNRG